MNNREIRLNSKPWINDRISKMIKIRDKYFARKKRQPSNVNVKRVYNLFRNRVNREVKRTKKAYYSEYFSQHSNNIRKTWQGIRELVNVKKGAKTSISQISHKGNIISNSSEIAESFNEYFVNVGPETEKSIPRVNHISPSKFLKDRIVNNFVLGHITPNEVYNVINALPKKGTGPASIPLGLLKTISDLVIFPLAHIINLSFSTGVFPDTLKIAKVLPLFKGGSSEVLGNYRPISLLSIFDKMIEKLMHKRLYDFLELHSVLFMSQFGF